MKPDKKKFAEILLKMSYHAHQINYKTPDKDLEYLNKFLKNNSESMLYEETAKKEKDN